MKRDQLMEIATLMNNHFVHELTENGLTVECVQELVSGIIEAWHILDDMDDFRADEWQNKWQDVTFA